MWTSSHENSCTCNKYCKFTVSILVNNKKLQRASWAAVQQAFSFWAFLLPYGASRKLAHWAKCLHLGVGQVVLEKCTSSLNGLRVYLLDQNKVRRLKWIIVFQKIASWLQIAMTFPSFNSLAEKHWQKSSKMASFFFPAMAVSTGVKQKSRVLDHNDGGLHVPVK